jgi:hypothetical protein
MSLAIAAVPLAACAKFTVHYKVGYQGQIPPTLTCPTMSNMAYPSGQLPASQLLLAPTCHQHKSDNLVPFAITVVPLATYTKAIIHYKVRYQ